MTGPPNTLLCDVFPSALNVQSKLPMAENSFGIWNDDQCLCCSCILLTLRGDGSFGWSSLELTSASLCPPEPRMFRRIDVECSDDRSLESDWDCSRCCDNTKLYSYWDIKTWVLGRKAAALTGIVFLDVYKEPIKPQWWSVSNCAFTNYLESLWIAVVAIQWLWRY